LHHPAAAHRRGKKARHRRRESDAAVREMITWHQLLPQTPSSTCSCQISPATLGNETPSTAPHKHLSQTGRLVRMTSSTRTTHYPVSGQQEAPAELSRGVDTAVCPNCVEPLAVRVTHLCLLLCVLETVVTAHVGVDTHEHKRRDLKIERSAVRKVANFCGALRSHRWMVTNKR